MPIASLLTTAEVAERLRICTGTLSKLVRTGGVPAPVYVGRKRLFDESALSDWLRGQTRDVASNTSKQSAAA